jgi:hypothetical protein
MEECVITSITKEAMIAALRSEPKFSELFMAYLLTRNSRVEEDLIDQLDSGLTWGEGPQIRKRKAAIES